MEGMQCGLGLGEVAPSLPKLVLLLELGLGLGRAELSCACFAVAYCRFVPSPWRNLEMRAPRALWVQRAPREGWMEIKSG